MRAGLATGAAVTDGDSAIDAIVAIHFTGADDAAPAVVASCGMSRETIADYAPQARVMLPGSKTVAVGDLLPERYARP